MTNNLRISIFIAATAAYWGSLYTYVPLLSPYAEHLGAGLTMVGFIVSAYGFSQLLLRVPIGILSDKLGKRRMFMILGGVSSLLAALGEQAFVIHLPKRRTFLNDQAIAGNVFRLQVQGSRQGGLPLLQALPG
jgi:MFS family permease